MDNQDKSILILILITSIVFITIGIVIISNSSVEEYKAPCVDGHGDVNLEGIMCEKERTCIMGDCDEGNEGIVFLGGVMVLMGILGFVISILGIVLDNLGRKD